MRVCFTIGQVGRGRPKVPSAIYMCDWGPGGPLTAPRSPAPDEKADLEMSISSEDAELVKRGELSPCVAFMQGRLKATGDNALLLEVLAWTVTAGFSEALCRGVPG